MKVHDLMVKEVVTIEEDASIEEAFKILHERHVGSVVITDEEEKCKGLFTERDAIRTVATRIPLSTAIREVMTKNIMTIWEGASFAQAKQLCRTQGIRHLPVVDEQNHIVGMLSIRNILDELIEL
ncbi:MAG: CBS domain-containing protein [Candidatus Bathyarchaeota archaeon]|nr:MAG: CBS domain-containing protein [Candidatus Bathyarchaeota archaeon]